MTIDIAKQYAATEHTAGTACSPHANGLKGSSILAIAQEVRQLKAEGREVHNLTIGDFDPSIFPIPAALKQGIQAALDEGQTNYPPAVGTPELRDAVCRLYARELGLSFPREAVIVGSGARPPIFSAFAALVAEGDTVVYPVPSWNVNHYCYLNHAQGVPLVTQPEQGFMPTLAQLRPHLSTARLIVINSPQNPSGTVIGAEALTGICDAILAENARRAELGERPLFLLYDAVYWRLTYDGAEHVTPIGLRPAMAAYTVMVDAVSKWWAGTGLRVGWGVAPPWVRQRMQALVGHMGAWAARAEQIATARLLDDESAAADYMPAFSRALSDRLKALATGIEAMQADGLPIRCLAVQGAIYLSVHLDLIGKTAPDGTVLADDEAVRSYILHQAGVAFVPFTAFGYPAGSGWLRLSVGSVTMEAVEGTLEGFRKVLTPFVD